jgi:hypothetical protein
VAALTVLAGCGSGGKTAPVSGTVTLDGKPLANALVTFQPIATAGKASAGMGSTGVTDGNGKYTLKTVDTDQAGAVVAKHSVIITMKPESSELDIPKPQKGLPAKYNLQSELQFDVTPQGTDAANFDLKSR